MRELSDRVNLITAIQPQNVAADGDIDGVTIDRSLYEYAEEMIFALHVGTITGSPTTFTADSKIQGSDDGSSWADITGLTGTQIIANNGVAEIHVDAKRYKRHLRLVSPIVLVAGTSPAVDISGSVAIAEQKSV